MKPSAAVVIDMSIVTFAWIVVAAVVGLIVLSYFFARSLDQ